MQTSSPVSIDFSAITDLFRIAHEQGRNFLYEYEVYTLLSRSGAETPPRANLIPMGARPSDEELLAIPGDRAVLKIVSPTIVHKTEVGGVRIVKREPDRIRSAWRRMLYEVPENYAAWIDRHPEAAPEPYRGLTGDVLIDAIRRDLKGVLQVQFMPPDSSAFGNELIVGLRRTREFGMVLSAGLGGTDTELYAERFRKGQAIVAASTELTDGEGFFALFRQTISYKKLAGLTRGQRRIVTDEQLIECFDSFIRMANHYSPANPDAPFIVDELEINPFAFTDYLMVPLDGMCRFSTPQQQAAPRPIAGIDALLHPKSIGIIGVSATRENFGRTILRNILAEGFAPEHVVVIREGETSIEGVTCVPSLAHLPEHMHGSVDLFVVAVGAAHVPELVEEIIARNAAASVMLIPGGMGETEDSRERAEQVTARINETHAAACVAGTRSPVFLGANCMGVVSRPGRYDTWFIPEEKLPKQRGGSHHRAALVSQSGAFMLHRISQCPELRPAYMISMGNQTDLTLGDMLHYFAHHDGVDVIAVYAEGFNDLDGLAFCRAVRSAVLAGKEVLFYKAGRTPEGKTATSGHTASLAGDHMVCDSCLRQAGAIVARSFTQFQDLFLLAETLHGKAVRGNRLAAVSGAGFEAVGMADSILSDDYAMRLAPYTVPTREALTAILREKRLDSLVGIANPMDINPAADDETHARVAEILAQDSNVDAVVVGLDPLSPMMHTLAQTPNPAFDLAAPQGIATRMVTLAAATEKPLICVADGGTLYAPLRETLLAAGVPVFSLCDRAVDALAQYIQARLHMENIRSQHRHQEQTTCVTDTVSMSCLVS